MTAFATYSDLGTRMKRVFTEEEQPWITSLLDDAAALMRGAMRSPVYPPAEWAYTAYPHGGRVDLPDFVNDIVSVQQDSADIAYRRFEDTVTVDCGGPVHVTLNVGLTDPPADLLAINCVLVSGAILTVEAGIGLTAGGLSSVALDDFKAAWADAGAASGMALSEATCDYLESHYGRTGWVVETR